MKRDETRQLKSREDKDNHKTRHQQDKTRKTKNEAEQIQTKHFVVGI